MTREQEAWVWIVLIVMGVVLPTALVVVECLKLFGIGE